MKAWRVLLVVVLLSLGGCERTFRDMYDQPRYKPLAKSSLWSDGRSARPPVAFTQAYSEGTLAGSSSGRIGVVTPTPTIGPLDAIRDSLRPEVGQAATEETAVKLPPITAALLARGRQRFDIFCSPCHSVAGDGDGMVARRGFPHPPSFHSDRLREASDQHFYAVITNGYGVMHSYATRVPPADRLAIVAYIRALQLSQHAPLVSLGDQDRMQLDAAAGAASKGGAR